MTPPHVCFARAEEPVDRITEQLLDLAEGHFARRIDAVRKAMDATDFDAASRAVLELAARWTPDALAAMMSPALELAGLAGREEVFLDVEDGVDFAVEFVGQTFQEQIDFLRQKRVAPTRAWTDAMYGTHDRSFVVAGVTDLNMLEEFQAAIVEGARTGNIKTFAGEFDRLVEKYGWSYNGGRNWRIRTIFDTNIRTSYMAGRLKQMRDPAVVRLRPYWQYIHAETRVPLKPRPQHVAWDRLVLMHDDPWWLTHFPPNAWVCSCGVRTLSPGDLRRLGKTGPDTAPDVGLKPHKVRSTGETVLLPDGIGHGWDYMPGDHWTRGLVPSALIEDAGNAGPVGKNVVSIDEPEPIADLLLSSRPFSAPLLGGDLMPEDYARAFLQLFGADIGKPVLWQDATGTRIPISDELFRDRAGAWKITKRDREHYAAMLAETIMDPDEIWLGARLQPVQAQPGFEDLIITRRYVRLDQQAGTFAVFDLGSKLWTATTAFAPRSKSKPDFNYLNRQRIGKLLWKRRTRSG